MNSEKKMSDMISGIETIFNPYLTYSGNYPVYIELLEICSKKENNKNLVDEYLNRKYINNIRELVPIELGHIQLVSDESIDKTKGRVLKISLEDITDQVCLNLTLDKPDDLEDNNYRNYKLVVKDFFKPYKLAISSLLKKEENKELEKYTNNLKQLFSIYLENTPNSNQNQDEHFYHFLKTIREDIGSFLLWYNQLIEICQKPIDLKELESLLDLDKFYFVMAEYLLEINKFSDQKFNCLQSSMAYVDIYVQKLIQLKKENNYSLCVNMPQLDGKMVTATTDSLIEEFIKLKNKYPEYQVVYFQPKDGINYRDIDVFNQIVTALEDERNAKKLAVSWKLFKKGEKEKGENTNQIISHIKKEEKSQEEKNRELRNRLDFFETSPYLYHVEGINNFEGYLGYIYPNNLVIFERFYKDTKKYEPADNNATYIMTLNNFIEMSKLSKLEIMQYIKDGNTDVVRKYHTSSWKNKITAVIEGKGYDIDTIQIIGELINTHQLEKKGVTK